MEIKAFEALMDKHHLSGYTLNGAGRSGVTKKDGKLVAEMGGLPNLRFFAELSRLSGVPIEDIQVEDSDHGSGCETCGYGGGVVYTVTLPAKRNPKQQKEST